MHVDPEVAARLRSWAPECLREPFLRAIGERGYPERRVSAAIDFTEACLRYFVALLAPEGEAKALDVLRGKLDRPSLGHWLSAADGLAASLCRQPAALAHPAALALRSPAGKRTEAVRALEALVEARNHLAHRGGLDTTSDRAIQRYEREMVPALRTVFAALGCVEQLPIYAFDAIDREHGRATRLLRFAGADPEVLVVEAPPTVRALEPLLIGDDGRTVELGPFMAVRVGGDLRPFLLDRVDRSDGAFFLDSKGLDPFRAPDAWKDRWFGAQAVPPRATDAHPALASVHRTGPATSRPLAGHPTAAPGARPRGRRRAGPLIAAGLVALGGGATWLAWPPPSVTAPTLAAAQRSEAAPKTAPAPPPASGCTCEGVAPRQVFLTCPQSAVEIDLEAVQGAGVAAVRNAWRKAQRGDTEGARDLAEEAIVAFDCEIRRLRYDLVKAGVICPESPARAENIPPGCAPLARPIGDRAWAYNIAGDLGRAENGQRDLLALQSRPELQAASYQQLAELRCRQARPAEAIEFLEESLRLKPEGKGVELRQDMLADIRRTCRL